MRARSRVVGRIAVLLLAGAAVACEESPEAAYEKASRELASAHEAVERAQHSVEDAETRLSKVQERVAKELEEAQGEVAHRRDLLQKSQAHLAKTEARVNEVATDELVFRSLQRRLLEDDALSGAAISARVEQGVAFLAGRVPKEPARRRAEEIARRTAGVRDVRSEIRVAPRDPGRSAPDT